MVYSWKNYGYSVSADVAGKEFEKIEKEYGSVTSELVLQSATPEDSPLHNVFEWDDSKAAHSYRLQQAAVLICNLSCEVDPEEDEKKPITVRAFVDVSENIRGQFVNVTSAFKNVDTREIVLKRALAELKAFEDKYKNLLELASLFEVIDDLIEKGA